MLPSPGEDEVGKGADSPLGLGGEAEDARRLERRAFRYARFLFEPAQARAWETTYLDGPDSDSALSALFTTVERIRVVPHLRIPEARDVYWPHYRAIELIYRKNQIFAKMSLVDGAEREALTARYERLNAEFEARKAEVSEIESRLLTLYVS